MNTHSRGSSLLEVVVATAAASLVISLVGALLVAGLAIWARGRDVREAQMEAAVILDAILRDVRSSSQTGILSLENPGHSEHGDIVLTIIGEAPSGDADTTRNISYAWNRHTGEIRRLAGLKSENGIRAMGDVRLVGAGVVDFTVEMLSMGVAVEVALRRGLALSRLRLSGQPQNP